MEEKIFKTIKISKAKVKEMLEEYIDDYGYSYHNYSYWGDIKLNDDGSAILKAWRWKDDEY